MHEWLTAGPVVGVIMGSDSDWPTMQAAAEALAEFDVGHEVRVLSAHRTPEAMLAYARDGRPAGACGSSSPAPAAPPTCPAWWPAPRRCR